VRLGDSITISQAEAEVLQSDPFRKFASPDVTSQILLTPSGSGYYSLALPKVGRQIIGALSAFAASGVQPEAAITAEGLAVAIAQRISPK
jgi:hypothetical protein